MDPADIGYYGSSLALGVLLAITAVLAARLRSVDDDMRKRSAKGIAAAAGGLLLVLTSGVVLNYLRPLTGDLFFQQVHFPAFYVGFGAVLFGFSMVADLEAGRIGRWVLLGIWTAFLATIGVAGTLLAGAANTIVDGHVPAKQVYFLPIFFALVASTLGLLVVAAFQGRRHQSVAPTGWFCAATVFALVGLLREATVIPSSGVPFIDVMAAFGPFLLAALSLWLAQRSLATLRASQT